MTTHFQGRFEVEFKYRLTDSAAFLRALEALGPEMRETRSYRTLCEQSAHLRQEESAP